MFVARVRGQLARRGGFRRYSNLLRCRTVRCSRRL